MRYEPRSRRPSSSRSWAGPLAAEQPCVGRRLRGDFHRAWLAPAAGLATVLPAGDPRLREVLRRVHGRACREGEMLASVIVEARPHDHPANHPRERSRVAA